MNVQIMLNNFFRNSKISLIIFTLIIIVGLLTRIQCQRNGEGHRNYDISAHVELTGRSYESMEFKDHYFLPIVNQKIEDQSEDSKHHFRWGTCVPSRDNKAYIYTSFTAPTFVLPYVAYSLFHFDYYQNAILLISCICFLISSLTIYLILCRAYKIFYSKSPPLWTIITLALMMSFIPESIVSLGGLNFWAHTLALPFQLLIVLLLLHINFKEKVRLGQMLSLFSLCSIAAYSEWSSFIGLFFLSISLILALLFRKKSSFKTKTLTFYLFTVIASAVFALFIIITHYYSKIDLMDFIEMSYARTNARSDVNRGILLLYIKALWNAYYTFTIVLILPLLYVIVRYKTAFSRKLIPAVFALAFIFGLLLENLLLMPHAEMYTYDLLKWMACIPFILALVPIYFNQAKSTTKSLIILILLIGVASSYLSVQKEYNARIVENQQFGKLLSNNRSLFQTAVNETGLPVDDICIAYTGKTRGSESLLSQSLQYELFNEKILLKKMEESNSKAGILFTNNEMIFRDVRKISSYKIYKATHN